MPTPPPTVDENATPLYGIRSPKPSARAYLLGTLLGHTTADIETVLQEFGLPTVATGTPVVAASAAARDAHWGVPASAAARRALQDLGAMTVRTDLGYTEQYFAGLTDGGANPGGKITAGWMPVAGSAVGVTLSTSASLATGSVVVVGSGTIPWTEDSDPYGWHHPSVNPTRITPTFPGRYLLQNLMSWAPNGSGTRLVVVRKNGVNIPGGQSTISAAVDSSGQAPLSVPIDMNGTTDYLELAVLQTSGGNLTLTDTMYLTFVG